MLRMYFLAELKRSLVERKRSKIAGGAELVQVQSVCLACNTVLGLNFKKTSEKGQRTINGIRYFILAGRF